MINIIDIDPKYLEGIQLDVKGVGINQVKVFQFENFKEFQREKQCLLK